MPQTYMPMRPGVSGRSGSLRPVSELWIRMSLIGCSSSGPRREPRTQLRFGNQCQQRLQFRAMAARRQGNSERQVQIASLAARCTLHGTRDGPDVRARGIERRHRRAEELRAGGPEQLAIKRCRGRQLAEYDVDPMVGIRRQHDVVADEVDEGLSIARACACRELGRKPRLERRRIGPFDGQLLPVIQLVLVEAGGRTAKVSHGEELRHVRGLEPAIALRRMAEAKEMIEERRREIAALTQFADRCAAVALGELLPVRAEQQSHMTIARRAQVERRQDHELARSVRKVIVAAQHLRHAHERIVDGIAEEKRRIALRPANDEIADVIREESLRPMHQIVEADFGCRRDAKAGRLRQTLRPAFRPLRLAERAAGARVSWRSSGGELRLAREFEFQRRAETRVGQPERRELREMPGIYRGPPGLQVWPVTAADIRSLVPGDSEPGELLDERSGVNFDAAFAVSVLHAQDEAAAAVTRHEKTEEGRPRVTEMQGTRGARSKSRDRRTVHGPVCYSNARGCRHWPSAPSSPMIHAQSRDQDDS